MRLIDADAMIPNGLQNKTIEIRSYDADEKVMLLFRDAQKFIALQPTIDAVPIVRCKDCKYYWKNHADDISAPVCLASPKDDAFCSEGERR